MIVYFGNCNVSMLVALEYVEAMSLREGVWVCGMACGRSF